MSIRLFRLAPLLLLLQGPAPPAGAQGEAAGARMPRLDGTLRLSLVESVQMGLENNLDVEVQRFAPRIAGEDARAALGAYDPELFAQYDYESIESPNAFSLNSVGLSREFTSRGFGGLRGLVPLLGSSYELRFDSSRVDTNSTIQSLDPELRSSWNAALTQPVLRDLLWNSEWTRVKTTRAGHDRAREQFREQVMNSVREIEEAYWELVALEEQLRVADKSLDTARALLEQTRTQFEVGVVSKVEVVEAEAGVADRELNRIRAENGYLNQQDRLINLVLGPHWAAESTLAIEPTDRPQDYVPYEIDVEDAVRQAFSHRPELAVLQQEIEQQQLELGLATNQLLPQLDVVLSYGNRGLAGSGNRDLNPAFGAPPPDRSYGDSMDRFFTGSAAEQFTAGARFSFPIPNTAPRATRSRRAFELRQAQTRQRRLEQTIVLEVRNAARDLKSALEGIEAAERRRVAAEEQLRAERIRLEYGESTPFEVLLREEDFAEAESQKIVALREYRTSATDLDRAQGTILRNRNILIDEVSALR